MKIKFVMSLMAFLSFISIQVVAQTINSATDLKNFYIKYLSDNPDADKKAAADYCTVPLYEEWDKITSEVYDPFTLGYFEDNDLIKQSIVIKEKSPKTMYEVSFKVHEYSNKQIKTVSLIIHVEENGKIHKIVRSSDNMTIEDTKLTTSTSNLDGTTWQIEKEYSRCTKNYIECTDGQIIKHIQNDTDCIPYDYYLSETIPTKFDSSKVGKQTKGHYLIQYDPEKKAFFSFAIQKTAKQLTLTRIKDKSGSSGGVSGAFRYVSYDMILDRSKINDRKPGSRKTPVKAEY